MIQMEFWPTSQAFRLVFVTEHEKNALFLLKEYFSRIRVNKKRHYDVYSSHLNTGLLTDGESARTKLFYKKKNINLLFLRLLQM